MKPVKRQVKEQVDSQVLPLVYKHVTVRVRDQIILADVYRQATLRVRLQVYDQFQEEVSETS